MADADQVAQDIIEEIRNASPMDAPHMPYVPSLDGMRARWDIDGYIETLLVDLAPPDLVDALRECDCPRMRGFQKHHNAGCYMLTDRASYDAFKAFQAAVTVRVGVHLAFCHTCGNPITGDGAGNWQCACWCILADELQNRLGRDFDGAAQEASDMWRDARDDWPRVWSGEHAAEHHGLTYYPEPGHPGIVTTF